MGDYLQGVMESLVAAEQVRMLFGHEVTHIRHTENNSAGRPWEVTTTTGNSTGNSTGGGGSGVTSAFDAVVVANGHYEEPNIPDIAGHDTWPGKIVHSVDYSTPDEYAGSTLQLLSRTRRRSACMYPISMTRSRVAVSCLLFRRASWQCVALLFVLMCVLARRCVGRTVGGAKGRWLSSARSRLAPTSRGSCLLWRMCIACRVNVPLLPCRRKVPTRPSPQGPRYSNCGRMAAWSLSTDQWWKTWTISCFAPGTSYEPYGTLVRHTFVRARS